MITLNMIMGCMVCARNLKKYHEKRDFDKTPEPRGRVVKKSKKEPIFVIQKHAARALHYDFRLEIDGVLTSWAIPKGPSLNPADKRLAVLTEDHPMQYAYFEGVIPPGEYGAGPVMVWDSGTYTNLKTQNGKQVSMKQALKDGQIEIFVHGKKLQGGFAFVRTSLGNNRKNWLLVKMRDEYASARKQPVKYQNKSAISNRTMKQIIADEKKKSD